MKYYFVYIVQCADKSLYTGITNDVEKRLMEHNTGVDPDSYRRRPVTLLYQISFTDPVTAIEMEKQIKGWTRKKKWALVNEQWDQLLLLAECQNESSHKKLKGEK